MIGRFFGYFKKNPTSRKESSDRFGGFVSARNYRNVVSHPTIKDIKKFLSGTTYEARIQINLKGSNESIRLNLIVSEKDFWKLCKNPGEFYSKGNPKSISRFYSEMGSDQDEVDYVTIVEAYRR